MKQHEEHEGRQVKWGGTAESQGWMGLQEGAGHPGEQVKPMEQTSASEPSTK